MIGGSASYETEQEQRNTPPRLQLLFNPPPMMMHSPERSPSGMVTPPLYTSASVPFQWEQEPGKPRPSIALVNTFFPKCLELPPRLEGPFVSNNKCYHSPYGSFGSQRLQLGTTVPNKGVGIKEKGWFGSWKGKRAFKIRREVSGGSYVVPSSSADRDDDDHHVGFTTEGVSHKMRVTKMKGSSGRFHNLFQSKLWTKICEVLKQVPSWRSTKLKKVGYGALSS